MCGIVGMLGSHALHETIGYKELLLQMANTVIHRGPDDAGYWFDVNERIGLAHRRLSVVDLSPAGHQPMVSASGRFVIVFNGEIYNHLSIRTELEKLGQEPVWLGRSDTETLLAGFEAWGVEATLKKSIGMFAIALWDCALNTLTLVRDRIGEKPLYYGWQGSSDTKVFLFGSELKALKAHPAFVASVDRGALCLFLRHNYIPAPYSIYEGISKLEPGCLLTISLGQPKPKIIKYWDIVEVARTGVAKPFSGTAVEAVDSLEMLAKDAIRQQIMTDVPLGAFLSGGVDSSTVVALMQAQSSQSVKTFTIGFNEQDYNEAAHAKAVARHLGTDHNELYVTPEQAVDVIYRLPQLYSEPFADSSQIPTFLLSQLAREHVTVSLSGDAGDELFCGYSRYQSAQKQWKKIALVPKPLRSLLSKSITAMSPSTLDRLAEFIPGEERFTAIGDKLNRGSKVLACGAVEDLYIRVISHLHSPSDWVIGGQEPPTHLTGHRPNLDGIDAVQRMMALDMVSYLPDDILVKVDRASMGASLEGRVPFLDHRIVEFAWSLPLTLKLRDGQTKWPLRQVLYRHVPRMLIDRPKMGFGVPLREWLRGPLREWAESLLDEVRLKREGYFNSDLIRRKWVEHLAEQHDWASQLWNVLMFQAWLEENN
jgi:asparagine synthase (glutamine-hydrolysing)